MKPRVRIATARTPDGGEMVLYQHDSDFSIKINGQELMYSRHHESELELARLGCAHLDGRKAPSILIGGLGMGYTLRQALDMLSPHAQVLMSCSFHVRRFRVPAYKGSKSQSRFVWVASEDKIILPPGGGEPRLPFKNGSKGSRKRPRKRR